MGKTSPSVEALPPSRKLAISPNRLTAAATCGLSDFKVPAERGNCTIARARLTLTPGHDNNSGASFFLLSWASVFSSRDSKSGVISSFK